jgi:hypothetical protein
MENGKWKMENVKVESYRSRLARVTPKASLRGKLRSRFVRF